MKHNILLSGFVFFFTIHFSQAQISKGDRILAWQVDMTETADYDAAFAFAQEACMESIHVAVAWSNVEPEVGIFDSEYIAGILDVMNLYYPFTGTKVELQFAPTNTTTREVPLGLETTDFSDPAMIDEFKRALDTLFAHIPDVQLSALNIGNETDILFGEEASKYEDYKTFLDAVIPHAKSLYESIHGEELKVGTTLTFDAFGT